jgi:LacI family kdg operon repressor
MEGPVPIRRLPRATIADVASTAGVSKATVSRFLNHRDRLLSVEIADRVEAAINRLNYTPSQMAQALSHGRSRLIGLIVADITNPYSVAVFRGAEKVCHEAGYLLMLFNLGNAPDREREAIDSLAAYQVDGFILNTLGRGGGADDIAALHGKPAVLVDRRHADMHADFVSLDNRAAMRIACSHLVEGGYRTLLYVTEPRKGVSSRRERAAAFRLCAGAHRAQGVSAQMHECDADQDSQLDAVLAELGQRAACNEPAAVIGGNAVITLRVAGAMSRLGLRFGRDLGFVGFDDPEWAHLIGPGLTAVAQPTDSIGRAAATCLVERLRGFAGPPRQTLLGGDLIVRGSSALL